MDYLEEALKYASKKQWKSGENQWLQKVKDPNPSGPLYIYQGVFLSHFRVAGEVRMCRTRYQLIDDPVSCVIFLLNPKTLQWEVNPNVQAAYLAWRVKSKTYLKYLEKITNK